MQETIFLNQVLEIMRTPNNEGRAVKFDIAVRTFNKNSKSGGRMQRFESAKLVMEEKPLNSLGLHNLQKLPSEKRETFKKSPNHFTNKTRNIRLDNGDIKKIHFRFIDTFNGKKVIY